MPAENYTEEQTENFISIAEEILKWAQEKIK
ncbi:hypothetical protein HZA96_07275 [Candidatus Woesearchaeota archaeon]|nr:hypothetical protein [Candidatus Woesearchaeota archaeon]